MSGCAIRFKTIFVQVVNLLAEQGLVSLKEVYVDGTKLEANANKYTFVWGNAIKTNKLKMKQQLDELWRYAKRVAAEERELPEPPPFETIDAEKVNEVIGQIQQAIEEDQSQQGQQVKQKLKYAKKNCLRR